MPSSRYLAKGMIKVLENNLTLSERKPLKVLELGAGTGAFTGHILKQLRADDHMDVIEINEHFYNMIKKNHQADNLHIHHCDFLKFNSIHKYDYIFSSIPYEQLSPEISKQIWKRKLSLCLDGSYITYYKYVNYKQFRCKFEKEVVHKYKNDKKIVFRNVPPAQVFTLQINNLESEDFKYLHEVA
ncbi:MAG: rRNA adenine N-6-methyltransferase family protein [Balneolales bacterium]